MIVKLHTFSPTQWAKWAVLLIARPNPTLKRSPFAALTDGRLVVAGEPTPATAHQPVTNQTERTEAALLACLLTSAQFSSACSRFSLSFLSSLPPYSHKVRTSKTGEVEQQRARRRRRSSMSGEAKKLFTASEVALHASRKDCWVVIGGKVFDVTKFLEDHPGGEDVFLHASASGDATEAFEEVGHSTSAIGMMDSYLIGSIKDYVRPSASKATDPWGLDGPPNSRTMQGNKGPPNPNAFLDFLLPLFVLGLAFAAWYYLTFVSKNQ